MKTTVEISPAQLTEAKRHAQAEHTTLKALIEAGLRSVLVEKKSNQPPFKLRDGSFKGGKGLTPEFQNAPWEKFLDAILMTMKGGDDRAGIHSSLLIGQRLLVYARAKIA